MKFWQRLLLLGSSFFLVGTIYYYIALDSSGMDRDLRLHHRRRDVHFRLGETNFKEVFKAFSQDMDPEVCSMRPGGGRGGGGRRGVNSSASANLSTLDLFYKADFNVLGDGMYELPTPPPDFPRTSYQPEKVKNLKASPSKDSPRTSSEKESNLEPLTVILMPHSHTDPGWQKTTGEYYADQTKHILTNMVNKLTEHPDLTFVWSETVYFALWWNELEDAVKVHVRRLIRRGQLEIVLGGWVVPDEASSHYVSVIDQLMEGHQWLWENLRVKPVNSWSIDPFGYSGSMPYLWKLAGMDNMVIQRVHQAVKASLMTKRSMEFYWRQFWESHPLPSDSKKYSYPSSPSSSPSSSSDILCHIMPYMLYSIKFSCGPNRFVCLLFDFRSVPGEITNSRAQAITETNVEKFSEYLYKQFRQKSFFYKYNTILVPIGDDFRYEKEMEWDQQYGNYSRLMRYMNARKDWKVKVRFGTLKDYFRLTREEQLSKKFSGKPDTDFPTLSGDFFPYSDLNLDYWTGYYTTRAFDKRFQREVQGMIQAADVSLTLLYALYKSWGLPMREKFFHLASLMQTSHRAQAQFLHHDAITGTSKDFVVVDFESQLLAAYTATQSVMSMAMQGMITKGKVETPKVFYPETVRSKFNVPPKKVKLRVPRDGLLVFVYNPLPRFRRQPVHLLVDSNLVYVKNQRREILASQISPVWEEEDIGVKGDVYELVFVADLPPLATIPFVIFPQDTLPRVTVPARISVFNSETVVVPPQTLFPQNQPQATHSEPVVLENSRVRIRVDPSSGELMDFEDRVTGNVTVLRMGLEVYRSQGSGAYLFKPQSGSDALIANPPLVRVVEGPVVSYLTVVYEPYISQTFTLYHHPELLSSAVHVRNQLNIQTLKDREVIMRMKTDLKKPHFFTDQNGMQFIRRLTNENTAVEANYYPVTSGGFLDDGLRRVTLLTAQPHGAASLETGWMEVMLDRHLVYDDGRGLGEGVEDIKPATSEFVLTVESRPPDKDSAESTPHKKDESQSSHYAFPTLQTLALGDRLQQPLQVFYSQVDSDIFFRAVEPFKVALPCDVALLSLRSLATGNLNYNGTSLLLHRRAYDCDFPTPSGSFLECSLGGGGGKVTFQDLFKGLGLGVQSVRETSLTHLHHKRLLAPDSRLDLRPMQIGSYHVVF
ncbi:hypothetical protein ACOMHN_059339 [Nucella lapillus]